MDRVTPDIYDKYIKALMDISQAITSDLYLEDILKLIVMVTAKVTGVEICSLWLIDEDTTPPIIRLKATQAIEPDYVKDRALTMDANPGLRKKKWPKNWGWHPWWGCRCRSGTIKLSAC